MSEGESLLIFTDLDGTLLDHDNYSFAAAEPALKIIKQRGYPLILNSSKTRAEIEKLQQTLEIDFPFICENGAAVFWREAGALKQQPFSTGREALLKISGALREEYGFNFLGFSDCSIDKIVELTGLDFASAELAAQRDFTEPMLWLDSEERLEQFRALLAKKKIRAVQGGRFISLMGEFDKSEAMQWLKERYKKEGEITTVALGDSPNDEQMLDAADIAVVIRSERSDQLTIKNAQRQYRSTERGPAGWNEIMLKILQ